MIKELETYLRKTSENEKFKAELNTRLGYIRFSNSGQRGGVKYFVLGVDAIIQTLSDIRSNISKFQGSEEYIEKEWRDLGSSFYTDSTANAMATVQTKPLFCTLSKVINWANEVEVEDYDTNLIDLSSDSLDKAVEKLKSLLSEYPKPNESKGEFPDKQVNTIYYGAPGTGKSHTIETILENVPRNNRETVTFHPDYDYASFVGGYRPITEKDSNGDESIKYKFVPQVFTNLYVKAWQKQNEQFYLTIEEINRGNCAEIFGDIFQLLDQNLKYTVTPSSELRAYLVNELSETHPGIIDGLKMPNNLTIMATMNTSDQSLFPMDSAFKRRWDWEYVPINYERSEDNPSSKFIVRLDENRYFYWIDFIEKVNAEIKKNHNLGMDKCIGNYFIKPELDTITLKTFINKAMFYLWNDVFKDEFGDESIFDADITYEDYFPIESEGKNKVESLLNNLKVDIHQVAGIISDEDTP